VPARREALARHAEFPNNVEAAPLAADEVAWLSSQIMRDGRPTKTEFELLRYFAGDASGASEANGADPERLQFLIQAT
jgi:hypothetical protein